MNKFFDNFQSERVILPVVHIESMDQVMRNVRVAKEVGAHGVFLISMRGAGIESLNEIYFGVKEMFPNFWVGVNDLTSSAVEVFAKIDRNYNGVWTDNARIKEVFNNQSEASQITHSKDQSGWSGLYFGGVAFKYQETVYDVEKAAKIASQYMDVVVTSGVKTGMAPDVEKIELMKRGVGEVPLAIASGISSTNIHKYLHIADAFLVASSLLKPNTEDFDPVKMEALVKAVRNYK